MEEKCTFSFNVKFVGSKLVIYFLLYSYSDK